MKTPEDALAFVEEQGIVLESGRGPVPSLAETIAGEAIRGSWWGHPKGRLIFRATRFLRDSPDVLLFRLVEGKLTYVHRRLWAPLVRLADEIGRERLAAIREEHTATGAHKNVEVAFPEWVPRDVHAAAKRMSRDEARDILGDRV